ncbi:right-handed parallel beta-helix repeat-containing protein [Tabrizicola sp. WMC-M-20]|nr:right-handed parallel beta-helix repeat-containing protein [Tabrizicola sp. WMC-M-20]
MKPTKRSFLSATAAFIVLATAAAPSLAQTTHHVAPKGAQITCTGTQGSSTCPWGSTVTALKSGKVLGGDTLLLQDGLHDRMFIDGPKFTSPVTIKAKTPHKASIDTIGLRNANGITFQDLTVISTPAYNFPLIRTEDTTSHLVFDNLDVRSVANIDNVLSWSQTEWLANRRHGIWLYGTDSRVSNSTVRAVQGGIWSNGTRNEILNNKVTNLSGDGLRGTTRNIVRGNHVSNFFRVDTDHIDGFQSISGTTNPVTGLVIESNSILEWTHSTSNPLQTSIQGLGLFDGFYDDVLIQNNIISISAHHGIGIYGGRTGKVVNNTVVHRSGNPEKYPWIGIFNHKNGTPSTDMLVANNVAMAFSGASDTNRNVLIDNQVILYPAQAFQDVTKFNYEPKSDSGLIDSGNAKHAPAVDFNGILRPQGAGPDKGAFEAASASVAPPIIYETPTSAPAPQPVATYPVEPIDTDTSTSDNIPTDADVDVTSNPKPVRSRSFWTDGVLSKGPKLKQRTKTSLTTSRTTSRTTKFSWKIVQP